MLLKLLSLFPLWLWLQVSPGSGSRDCDGYHLQIQPMKSSCTWSQPTFFSLLLSEYRVSQRSEGQESMEPQSPGSAWKNACQKPRWTVQECTVGSPLGEVAAELLGFAYFSQAVAISSHINQALAQMGKSCYSTVLHLKHWKALHTILVHDNVLLNTSPSMSKCQVIYGVCMRGGVQTAHHLLKVNGKDRKAKGR